MAQLAGEGNSHLGNLTPLSARCLGVSLAGSWTEPSF
jgi:hypothetical protein